MARNFFFIDDSGSKDWETPYSLDFIKNPPVRHPRNLNFWRRNYFVLAGLHISGEDIKKLNPQINKIKIDYFGTKHVEIKSDWLRNPHQRKKHYLDKFKISEERLKEFIETKWYKFFEDYPDSIQIQALILDKRYYKNKRGENTPLQLLTQALFDRVELHPHRCCVIVFDQMDDQIKSVAHNQGQILKISSKEIDLGSFHKKYSHTKPRFEKSKNSNFLQLADTVAYNVYRQFVDFGDIWENKKAKEFKIYSYLEKLTKNFFNKNGVIAGFGIVKIPDPVKNRWKKKA